MKHMIILVLIIFSLPALAAGNDLLQILDTRMIPPDDIVTEIRITTFKDNTPQSEKGFTFFKDNLTDQFLLICTSPLSRKGSAYVKRKDRIWTYSPITRTFFYTGKFDLIEETAVRIEDLLPKEYGKNYTIHARNKTEMNRKPVLKLTLKAKSETAPYDRIMIWLEEEKMLIVKEELYDSGLHLLKTIQYSGYREKDGWYQPSSILITDVVEGNMTSLTHIGKTTLSPVPEYVFTRSFVEFITR